MKCPHCETSNQANRKFCRACGKVLRKSVTCGSCGKSISADSHFCRYCGEESREYSGSAKERNTKKNSSHKGVKKEVIAFSIIGVFVLLIGFIVVRSVRNPRPNSSFALPNSVAPPISAISLQVDRISEGFMCPCGECNLVLKDCDCDNPKGAREIKGLIGSLLSRGTPEAEIVIEVDGKYHNKI